MYKKIRFPFVRVNSFVRFGVGAIFGIALTLLFLGAMTITYAQMRDSSRQIRDFWYMLSGTDLPATCTPGMAFIDTDDDACLDAGGGSGSACFCTATNTWTASAAFDGVLAGILTFTIPTTMTPTGNTQTITWSSGGVQVIDLESATGDVTLTFSGSTAGQTLLLKVIQDSGGAARDLIWPATVKWQGGALPIISAANDSIDLVICTYDGTNYLCDIGQNYQ